MTQVKDAQPPNGAGLATVLGYSLGTILVASGVIAFALVDFNDRFRTFVTLLLGPIALWKDMLRGGPTLEGALVVSVPSLVILVPLAASILARLRWAVVVSSLLWPLVTAAAFSAVYI